MNSTTRRLYYTTESGCFCPDRKFRQRTCKHMRALRDAYALIAAQEAHNRAALDTGEPIGKAIRRALTGAAA